MEVRNEGQVEEERKDKKHYLWRSGRKQEDRDSFKAGNEHQKDTESAEVGQEEKGGGRRCQRGKRAGERKEVVLTLPFLFLHFLPTHRLLHITT